MEIEKLLTVPAPIETVWRVLLDPKAMAGCVPGTQSVEILGEGEYLADIKVRISFISAHFKVRTKIVEARAPDYLRCEGTGEDALVASSMKQTSELFLRALPSGDTEVRVKAKVDVLGRLGAFGLSVMRTKADRMWDEFTSNLLALLSRSGSGETAATQRSGGEATSFAPDAAAGKAMAQGVSNGSDESGPRSKPQNWWRRLTGVKADASVIGRERLASDIYIELHRNGEVLRILWPSAATADLPTCLRDLLS